MENKEKQVTKELMAYLNSYSCNPAKLAKALAEQHPTLQQKLVKTIVEYLKIISNKQFYYDDRNKQAVAFAKDVKKADLLEKYKYPMY